ncbi:MAG: hypothetical protein ACRDFY_00985 [Candidatus Limnocylindria bacterium]
MQRLLLHGFVAAALAIAISAAPAATVHACSCMEMQPAEAVEMADLAFIGTVIDSAPGGQDPAVGMPMVRYAFAVARASEQTGPTIEVAALDDGGGATCGFTFGAEERWFVAASTDGGVLQSNLCSGNLMLDGMDDAEVAALDELLPFEPTSTAADPTAAPASPATSTDGGPGLPIVAAVIVAAGAAAALALVLLRARRHRFPPG